ncbi:MAG: TonB-dependent receptor [Bacteroidia bacterium]
MNFKKIIFRTAFSLLAFFIVATANAQDANIRGFVYLKATGEPVLFTNVYLQGTTIGASTDVNGYYSITQIHPGTYTLMVSSIGYDTLKEIITVKAEDIITRKLYLVKSAVAMKTFTVSAEQQKKQTDVLISSFSITPQEIKKLPSVGGEPDIAQYMQILPGVNFTGDQGGQLYIAGGEPVDNEVLLDGMVVYNPFHSIGLFSVFDDDIIKNADVHTAGFNAEYGDRISSVMDITTRDGNKQRVTGKVSASPFGAKTMVEGPLKKDTTGTGSTISFIVSAKTSYLQQTSKILYPYVDSGNGLPFNFTDLYGKVSFNGANGSKLNVFGFNYTDQVKYQAISNLNWTQTGVGSNFVVIPSSSSVLIEGNFDYSSYKIGMTEPDISPRSSGVNGFNMGLAFTYFMGKNEIKYGINISGTKTSLDIFNSVNREINQTNNSTELDGYLKTKLISKNGKLVVEPGIRLQYYASLPDFSPEPRLGVKYNVTKNFRLKAAAGIYTQNLISSTSQLDVVDLFYGFLSSPQQLQSQFTQQNGTVTNVTNNLQKADHIVFGFEYDFLKHFSLNVEAYEKFFNQLLELNPYQIYTSDNVNPQSLVNVPDVLKQDFLVESGTAKGLDFLLKYEYKHVYVWAVYSLGYVTRWDGQISYPPNFDRRNNVNLVVSYDFGKDLDWTVGARWNYGSGFPFTQTQGFYENLNLQNNINANYTTANGNLGVLYGTQNQGRLPDYSRLDLSIKKKIVLTENSTLEVGAGVTNAYDRQNIFYFDRITYQRVNQLPIMPTVNVDWTF